MIWEIKIDESSDISTTIYKDNLFLGTRDYLAKINVSTGELVWKIKMPFCVATKMFCDGNSLYLAPGAWDIIYKISMKDGSIVWSRKTNLNYCAIFEHKGSIFLLSSNAILCINSVNGKEQWRWNLIEPNYTINDFDISECRKELYLNLVDRAFFVK